MCSERSAAMGRFWWMLVRRISTRARPVPRCATGISPGPSITTGRTIWRWRDSVTSGSRASELRASYAAQGITPDKDIIAYCNSATEASHVHFTLRYLLGYPRVRVYVGSWTEWAERKDLPIEVGKP